MQYASSIIINSVDSNKSPNVAIEFIFLGIYLMGLVLMAYRYASNVLLIKSLINDNEVSDYQQVKRVLVKTAIYPFSFGRYIFVNKHDYTQGCIDDDIVAHEKAHINQHHTLDVMFIELVLIFYWFNPFLWLYRIALKANHEYTADNCIVRHRRHFADYCQKLLDYTNALTNPLLGSGFNYSLIKNRIIMIHRTKSSLIWFGHKLGIVIIVVFLAGMAFPLANIFLQHVSAQAQTSSSNVPKGWYKTGSHPASYDTGTSKMNGGMVAFLKSSEKQIEGFGTVMQMVSPDEYKGKRVKLSAKIKTEGVTRWCGLWFRVDGAGDKKLAFDNMQDRPIEGTTDWQQYEIVLDVSQESIAIAYGVLLSGTGAVWIDDVNFDVVNTNIPTTSIKMPQGIPKVPSNLDFEQ